VLSQFVDGSPLPMVSGIGGCALIAGVLTWFTLAKAAHASSAPAH
jgi:hypothetical protein